MENVKKEQKTGIKDLLKFKSYFLVLIANTISRFGDSVDMIAYAWMVYELTGSKILLGTIFAVNAIPGIILSPFAGVFVDHFSKKKVIILGDIGRGLIVSATAALFLTNQLKPWHLFVLTFLTSTIETFVSTAKTSLVPLILPEKLHLSASSFSTSAASFAQLVGIGSAGFLIATVGISGAIFIDALTFFISCLLISFLKLEEKRDGSLELNVKSYFSSLKEGFIFIKKEILLIISILLFAVTNFCLSPISVLLPAYVKDVLSSGAEALGILNLGFPIGMIIGGIIFAQIGSKLKKSYCVVFGLVSFGVAYIVLSLVGLIDNLIVPPIVVGFIAFFIFGLMMPVITAPLRAHLYARTPKDLLGRVVGLMSMVILSAMPLGGVVSGFLSEIMSIPYLFLLMGCLLIFIPFLALLNKEFRKA